MKQSFLFSILLLLNLHGFSQSNCASKITGVAPLSVFFDAVNPASGVVQPIEANGRLEYADNRYQWDFGDPGSGSWAVDSKSKNSAEGYVVSHVYDNPGEYTVTLRVTDTKGNTYTYTEVITVTDPDIVYSGSNTICISASGNFEGAPAGSLQVTTSDITDMFDYIDNGKRILLRRGDSWTTTGSGDLYGLSGPVTIGAYGEGINPSALGIYENAPVINVEANEVTFITVNNVADLRLMDISFNTSHSAAGVFGGNIKLRSLLMYRLKATYFATLLGNSHWVTKGHDQLAIVNCHLSEGLSNVVYIGSERLTIMGNCLKNAHESHVLRVWQSYKGVIAHNDISGSSTETDLGRHALKFHGPEESIISDDEQEGHVANRTRYTIIADNTFGSSGPWTVTIAPQNAATDERIQDVVFENNRLIADYGDSPRIVDLSLYVVASYITIRNNVFDGTGANSEFKGVNILLDGIVPHPFGNRVYNNTFYKMETDEGDSELIGVDIGENCENNSAWNNLAQFVEGGNIRIAVRDNGINSGVSSNLVTTNASFIDADNTNPLMRNFYIDSNSMAIDAGIPVPLFSDKAGNARPQGLGFDLGAYEYTSGVIAGINNQNSFTVDNVYPNPFRNHLTIRFSLSANERTTIKIYNLSGSVLETHEVDGIPGINYWNWTPGDEISRGFYLVSVSNSTTNISYKISCQR
ncbi:MAG: T9SS type A sorting domain-containing protein [Bacteroidales bacterium]|nr:T9SS type A sorting domain-containing protein [Bacteroidales bacterium]